MAQDGNSKQNTSNSSSSPKKDDKTTVSTIAEKRGVATKIIGDKKLELKIPNKEQTQEPKTVTTNSVKPQTISENQEPETRTMKAQEKEDNTQVEQQVEQPQPQQEQAKTLVAGEKKDISKMSLEELKDMTKGILTADEAHAISKQIENLENGDGEKTAPIDDNLPTKHEKEDKENVDLKEKDIIDYLYNDIMVHYTNKGTTWSLDKAEDAISWVYHKYADKRTENASDGKTETNTTTSSQTEKKSFETYKHKQEVDKIGSKDFDRIEKENPSSKGIENDYKNAREKDWDALEADSKFDKKTIEHIKGLSDKERNEKYSPKAAKKDAEVSAKMDKFSQKFGNSMAAAQMKEALAENKDAFQGKNMEEIFKKYSEEAQKQFNENIGKLTNARVDGKEIGQAAKNHLELANKTHEFADNKINKLNHRENGQTPEKNPHLGELKNLYQHIDKTVAEKNKGNPENLQETANKNNEKDQDINKKTSDHDNKKLQVKAGTINHDQRESIVTDRIGKIKSNKSMPASEYEKNKETGKGERKSVGDRTKNLANEVKTTGYKPHIPSRNQGR